MQTSTKNKNRNKPEKTRKAVVSEKVRDYGNDPFFVKKAEDSRRFLEKHGFPKEFTK